MSDSALSFNLLYAALSLNLGALLFLVCFQVEPNTKLFPAVFVRPTCANLFQFEFNKIKVCLFFYSKRKNIQCVNNM